MMMACGGGRNPTQSNLTRRDEFLDRFAIAAAHPTDPSLIVYSDTIGLSSPNIL